MEKKPNAYYYFIAKEFLNQAYSKNTARSFFDFDLQDKGTHTIVECFNGGAFVTLKIYDNKIQRFGNYSKHRFVNKEDIINKAKMLLNENLLPKYYSIQFNPNISSSVRCVTDIEKGKRDVIKLWNMAHTQRQIQEPIEWIIKEV